VANSAKVQVLVPPHVARTLRQIKRDRAWKAVLLRLVHVDMGGFIYCPWLLFLPVPYPLDCVAFFAERDGGHRGPNSGVGDVDSENSDTISLG